MSGAFGTHVYRLDHVLRDLEIAHKKAKAGELSWESLEQEIKELRAEFTRMIGCI